ncbi:protein gar2-like [Miscanthus floridulus]|uniref:protein gar2-like n=1 Tax=Miscanthus floridulus TaxID=154761 RepID=UPI00345788FC
MAGAGGMPPPLRLKDLLELDCDSCSAAGFRCYPRRLGESASAPMRHLLESSPSLTLRRHRPSKLSHLSRSLSRRLSRRGGFWSRRRDEEGEDTASAAATAASAGCGGSSSSEELELETSSSESSDNYSSGRTSRRRSRSESDSDLSSATEDSVHHPPSQAAGAGDEHEAVAMKRVSSKDKEGSSSLGSEADDKEQLSPVAVMDFPFDDDDDDELRDAAVTCTPSFSLARLQRRKTHKIRRFGSHDELGPLDLEARLAATTSDPDADGPADADSAQAQQMIQCRTEDASTPKCAGSVHRGAGGVHDVPDEDDLTSLLMGTVSGGLDDVSERLLRDFFVEMKRRRSEAHDAESELPLPGPAAGAVLRRKAERVVDGEAAVAAAARGWLEATGTERWGLADVLSGGAAIVAEMERGRGWMQVGEEEREVGAVVAGMLVDQLVGEVVRCLFV